MKTKNALTASSGLLNSLTSDSASAVSGMIPGSYAGYGQQMDSGNSLMGNIGDYMSNPDFMGGMGDLMGGIAGLGGLYLGYQQMKDTEKNNSLYRSVMNEQQNQANDFQNETNAVFGNTGRTNWQASGVRS